MTTRADQLAKLFNIIETIYIERKDMHPKVAAQFHVEWFITTHKNSQYFDQLLEQEIKDCSRALPAN